MKKRSHYPSLMVVTSKEEVKWYKVFRDRVEKLEEKNTEEWDLSDKEGHFEKRGHGEALGTAGVDIENAEERRIIEKHTKKVAEKTKELWDSNFKHLMIAVPEYLKNVVENRIEKALNRQEYKYIKGNFTHADKDKLLELAQDSLKVV
ncbi:MAG: hypothetical protein ABEJ02_02760 [Candidatus Paceibacteria bacterium]